MKLTHSQASIRSRKGWQKRKRTNPNSWTRELSGERVKLTGFSRNQIKAMEPAFRSIDASLNPNIKLNAEIRLAHTRALRRDYKRKIGPLKRGEKVGGITTISPFTRRARIDIDAQAFKKRGYYEPTGLITHEVGHVLTERKRRDHGYGKEFSRDYGWDAKRRHLKHPERWQQKKPGKSRDRSQVNAWEDFAESYRNYHGYNMTKRPNKHFQNGINYSHYGHIERHFA